MWNQLKKNKHIVKIYESVFGPIHWMEYKIRHMEFPSLEKTHYSYGKLNKSKRFYVIKYNRPECGIFSMIFHLLPQIEYAIRKKYVPIIDCRETYLPLLQDGENAGKENAWDCYFEQPKGFYPLDEVYQSKHVIYVRKNAFGIKKSLNYNNLPIPDRDLRYWSSILNQYIRPNTSLKSRIENEKRLFPFDNKILGVSVRAEYRWGGMIKNSLYYQHPKVPDCKTIISEISGIMNEWGYECFFFACDDREYSEEIAQYFGDKCIRLNRPLLHFFKNGMPVYSADDRVCEFKGYTTQKKTEDYITETYLLAQCESLYTCIGTGAQFAYIVNGGQYRHLKIYNLGLWSKEELVK